ncbi:MAG: PD40 domain-containing protein, partial [Planctomycetia bacterium]|nr:PD40 domain-containing protein [Planctomycetia bacterium]
MRSLVFLLLAALPLAAGAQSLPTPSSPPDLSKAHPFGVHDMVRMQKVGDPVPSPDGQWVVFTVRAWEAEANKATTNLWLVSVDGSKLRQLTTAKQLSDSSPTWAPDSSAIAFASNRSGSRQIWRIRLDGGEAKQLTNFPIDVENPKWSPAGTHVAFTAEVYPGAHMADTVKRDKVKADSPT